MLSAPRQPRLGSTALTHGIRVSVTPRFLPEQSDTHNRQYIFAYHVTIINESKAPVRLVSRRWMIVDSSGQGHEVRGDGVVGQQPRLVPGETHEYSSYCPLPTPWGTMEGVYQMRRDDGSEFEAQIARFYLVASGEDQ